MTRINPKSIQCADCISRNNFIFCGLENDELGNIAKKKITNVYKKGQTLFFQGNPPYGLYCIQDGKIKVSKIGNDGKESIVRIAGQGDILGHRCLFSEECYSATATAIEDSIICYLDQKFILKVIESNPKVSFNIIRRLCKDLGTAEKKMASLFQKNVRERLAEQLLALKDKYGQLEDQTWKLDIKLTREEMASMIGVANETLIRFITEFKEEGLIEQKGKTIYITNEEALIEFSNPIY